MTSTNHSFPRCYDSHNTIDWCKHWLENWPLWSFFEQDAASDLLSWMWMLGCVDIPCKKIYYHSHKRLNICWENNLPVIATSSLCTMTQPGLVRAKVGPSSGLPTKHRPLNAVCSAKKKKKKERENKNFANVFTSWKRTATHRHVCTCRLTRTLVGLKCV